MVDCLSLCLLLRQVFNHHLVALLLANALSMHNIRLHHHKREFLNRGRVECSLFRSALVRLNRYFLSDGALCRLLRVDLALEGVNLLKHLLADVVLRLCLLLRVLQRLWRVRIRLTLFLRLGLSLVKCISSLMLGAVEVLDP